MGERERGRGRGRERERQRQRQRQRMLLGLVIASWVGRQETVPEITHCPQTQPLLF